MWLMMMHDQWERKICVFLHNCFVFKRSGINVYLGLVKVSPDGGFIFCENKESNVCLFWC